MDNVAVIYVSFYGLWSDDCMLGLAPINPIKSICPISTVSTDLDLVQLEKW